MNYKNISKVIVTGLLFFFSTNDAASQNNVQKIGDNSFTIDINAVLELQSSTKGFLPPRMTGAEADALGTLLLARENDANRSTAQGMIVFRTDVFTDAKGNTVNPGLRVWSLTAKKVVVATPTTTPATYTTTFEPGWTSLEDSANKSSFTTLTSDGTDTGTASDILYPTQAAVKSYVDDKVTSKNVTSKGADYTVDADDSSKKDYTILCTAAMTLTLPTVTSDNTGRILVIRSTSNTNDIIAFAGGSIKYNGDTVSSVNYQRTIRVQSDGTNWVVID